MKEPADRSHPKRRVILDSNVLILLVYGLTDPKLIGHGRTNQFIPSDFELLTDILSSFNELVLTPHVLAETSNLLVNRRKAKTEPDDRGTRLMATLLNIVHRPDVRVDFSMASVRERHIPAKSISDHGLLLRLGIADAAIAIQKKLHVVTTDPGVYAAVSQHSPNNVTNLNHHRFQR